MPREGGIFGSGIADDRSDDDAYYEGKDESSESDVGDDVGRGISGAISDLTAGVFGDATTSQESAYDAGWEDGKEDR